VGERQNQPFQLSFNPSLKVDFQGSRVTVYDLADRICTVTIMTSGGKMTQYV